MCFTVNVNIVRDEMEKRYGAELNDPDYRPSYYYHAFELPGMPVLCMDNPEQILLFKWGLIPFWCNSTDQANRIRYQTFNARAETINEKPSFKQAIKSGRCLIPASGYYEWQHRNNKKIPFYIHLKDRGIFSFAGIYDHWTDKSTGEIISTFSIITTVANPKLAIIHNSKKRMPVILTQDEENVWLDSKLSLDKLLKLLDPYPEELVVAYSISPLISTKEAEKNRAELIEPFSWDPSALF
jgi:putative SOS response-associated peptidase YedK